MTKKELIELMKDCHEDTNIIVYLGKNIVDPPGEYKINYFDWDGMNTIHLVILKD